MSYEDKGDDHGGGRGSDHGYDIKVNGRPRTVQQKKQSYRDIAGIAYPDADFANFKYTITYLNGVHGAEGDLEEGEKVEITDGMVFNVRRSDKS